MGATISYIFGFVYQQLIYKPIYPTADLSGQTIVITGSNVGLGLDAAQHIVRLKASKVILAVRTESKGEHAKKHIVDALGADPARIEVWKLDMSSSQSVKAFADRLNQLERLDAVIENAGVLTHEWKMLEGDESHIKVNVISTVLLALLVLPKLRESGQKYKKSGTLSLVGSDLHLIAKFAEKNVHGKTLFEALNTERGSDIGDRYGTSKVLMMMAVRELAQKHPVSKDSPVVINCCNPGMCITTIFRDEGSWLKMKTIETMTGLFARSCEVGSRTLVNCIALTGEESHGKFVNNDQPSRTSSYIESEKGKRMQRQFWDELMMRLETIAPGASKNA
ncbi:MAG: hypothetical protein M1820_004955 [Bogoriella megaspora]|nr:MAG: hypothetical protein M1820_004955 [Bogoriella megaspora]